MDLERFTHLVETYGAQPGAWPGHERAAAQSLLQHDPDARRCLDEAYRLDSWLDSWTVASTASVERIVASLPPRHPLDKLLAWLFPRAPRKLWRPALAASLTLALGAALGAGLSPPVAQSQWETQERYLLMTTTPGEAL